MSSFGVLRAKNGNVSAAVLVVESSSFGLVLNLFVEKLSGLYTSEEVLRMVSVELSDSFLSSLGRLIHRFVEKLVGLYSSTAGFLYSVSGSRVRVLHLLVAKLSGLYSSVGVFFPEVVSVLSRLLLKSGASEVLILSAGGDLLHTYGVVSGTLRLISGLCRLRQGLV